MDQSFFNGGMAGIVVIMLGSILVGRIDVAARMVLVAVAHAVICAVMGW